MKLDFINPFSIFHFQKRGQDTVGNLEPRQRKIQKLEDLGIDEELVDLYEDDVLVTGVAKLKDLSKRKLKTKTKELLQATMDKIDGGEQRGDEARRNESRGKRAPGPKSRTETKFDRVKAPKTAPQQVRKIE